VALKLRNIKTLGASPQTPGVYPPGALPVSLKANGDRHLPIAGYCIKLTARVGLLSSMALFSRIKIITINL